MEVLVPTFSSTFCLYQKILIRPPFIYLISQHHALCLCKYSLQCLLDSYSQNVKAFTHREHYMPSNGFQCRNYCTKDIRPWRELYR